MYKFSPLQRAWIAALKSGKYKQGTRRLGKRTRNKKVEYCCLGVACVVAKKHGVKLKRETSGDFCVFGGQKAFPPTNVVEALRLHSKMGNINSESSFPCLSRMNDSGQYTHKMIAEFIESNPKKVFL